MTQLQDDVKAVRDGIEKGFIEHRMGDELISIPVRALERILDRLEKYDFAKALLQKAYDQLVYENAIRHALCADLLKEIEDSGLVEVA